MQVTKVFKSKNIYLNIFGKKEEVRQYVWRLLNSGAIQPDTADEKEREINSNELNGKTLISVYLDQVGFLNSLTNWYLSTVQGEQYEKLRNQKRLTGIQNTFARWAKAKALREFRGYKTEQYKYIQNLSGMEEFEVANAI